MDWSSDVCSSDLTTVAIRDAESDGRLVPPPRGKNNRRVGYTLGQLNDMRGTFGTRPWRQASDPCAIIAFQNFKGGVGNSTTTVPAAQNFDIKGYRDLLIDGAKIGIASCGARVGQL